MGQKYLSRREFIAAGGAAFAAATGLTIEQAMAQKGFRLRGAPAAVGGALATLTASDLTWLGYLRNDNGAGIGYLTERAEGQSIAMRTVAGEKRLFTWGSVEDDGTGWSFPRLLELKMATADPTTSLSTAPKNTFVKNWGPIGSGHIITQGGLVSAAKPGNGFELGGMYWDAARNAVWWCYGDIYGTSAKTYPTLCCTVLNDGAGTSVTYGPWTMQQPSFHFTRGCMTPLPQAWADVYAPGCDVVIMGHQASGANSCPFGLDARAFATFDPTTVPPNIEGDTYSISTVNLIEHTLVTRMSRDTRYKTCNWEYKTAPPDNFYVCGTAPISDGIPYWGGSDPASATADSIKGASWIQGSSKQGLLYWGTLVRTPIGYTAPGDPDGLVHRWYGSAGYATADPADNPGELNGYCCHGQPAPGWSGAGPASHFVQPLGWMADPARLGQVALGNIAATSGSDGSTLIEYKDICGALDIAPPTDLTAYVPAEFGKSGLFDAATNRLYIPNRCDTTTNPTHALRAAYLVFQVNC